MSDTNAIHDAARRSLASVGVAAIVITINHFYVLGPRALILGAFLIVMGLLTLLWFRRTRSNLPLGLYLVTSLWIVVGFGVYKGLWNGVLRLFAGTTLAALSTAYPPPVVGTFPFEASGILMFIASLFVAWYAVAFVRAVRASRAGSALVPDLPRRRVAVGAAAAGILVIGAYVGSHRDRWQPPANGVVTIGVLAPVTGPYAILGTSFVKAVEMARNDLHGTRYQYRLLIEDTGENPARAGDVVRATVAQSDAVIGAVSLIGQVTKPFAARARKPHLCICTVTPIGDGAYNFTNIPSPEAEALRWVGEARRRGIRSVAIIAQGYPSIDNHVRALRTELGRAGMTVTSAARFADSLSDFGPLISAARATTPDVFYVEALEPALDRLGAQLRDAKVRNVASVVAPSVSEHPELFEGVWYTDSDLADPAFRDRFEAKYPGIRFATHMMPYAYDSFNMIVQAYERGVNPAAYIRTLSRYDGAAGSETKRHGSGNFQSQPAVWVIRNGRPVLLDAVSTPTRVARMTP